MYLIMQKRTREQNLKVKVMVMGVKNNLLLLSDPLLYFGNASNITINFNFNQQLYCYMSQY